MTTVNYEQELKELANNIQADAVNDAIYHWSMNTDYEVEETPNATGKSLREILANIGISKAEQDNIRYTLSRTISDIILQGLRAGIIYALEHPESARSVFENGNTLCASPLEATIDIDADMPYYTSPY